MLNLQKGEYENKLRARGCHLLGHGLYSNVFSVPNKPDIVIKVGEMDIWPDYVKWSIENGHAGKFAPKVYSLKFHDGYYVAIVERLVCTIQELKFTPNGERQQRPVEQVSVFNTMHFADDCYATDLVDYIRLLRKADLTGDLHDGNVMVRRDGSMVITDPAAGSFSSARFRVKHGSTALA